MINIADIERPDHSLYLESQETVRLGDGSLEFGLRYVLWKPDDNSVLLDGRYSAADLRSLADHMDKYYCATPRAS